MRSQMGIELNYDFKCRGLIIRDAVSRRQGTDAIQEVVGALTPLLFWAFIRHNVQAFVYLNGDNLILEIITQFIILLIWRTWNILRAAAMAAVVMRRVQNPACNATSALWKKRYISGQ